MSKLEKIATRLQQKKRMLRDENGFTLVEILVTIGILVVVASVVVFALVNANRVNENVVLTTMSQSEVLNTTNSMTRDISAANEIIKAGDDFLQFETTVGGEQQLVTVFSYDDAKGNYEDSQLSSLQDKVKDDYIKGVFEVRVPIDGDPLTGTINTLLPGGEIDFLYFTSGGSQMTLTDGVATEDQISDISRVEFHLTTLGDDSSTINLASSASPRLGTGSNTGSNPGEGGTVPETSPVSPVLTAVLPPKTNTTQLSWTLVEGAQSYTLYRDSDEQDGAEVVGVYAYDESSTVDPGRTWGETYTYWITASGPGGISGNSNDATVTAVPRGTITGNAVDLSNTISWEEFNGVGTLATPVGSTSTGYELYRKESGSSDASATRIYRGLNTEYVDTNVSYGDTWVYFVIPFNQGGEGFKTNEVTLVSPPPAPVLTGDSTRGVRDLSWTAPTNVGYGQASTATAYEVRRVSPDADTHSTTLGTRTWSDNVAIDASTFRYEVRARNATGWGPWSTPVTINPRPEAPVLSGSHSDGIRNLTWTEAEDASITGSVYTELTGSTSSVGNVYELQRRSPQSTTWSTVSTNRAYEDDSSINSSNFVYRARAWNITGWGPWSNEVTLNPRPATPVVNVDDYRSHPTTRDNNNNVTWNTPANTTDFRFRNGSSSPEKTSTTTYAHNRPGYGTTTTYRVAACNITGCSSYGSEIGEQGPGPFAVNKITQIKSYGVDTTRNGMVDTLSNSNFSPSRYLGKFVTEWDKSTAATSYKYSFVPKGDSVSFRNATESDRVDGRHSNVQPTTAYTQTIRAVSANNLTRTISRDMWSAPAQSKNIKLGFRSNDGRNSGSWIKGDGKPIRGSFDKPQAFYTDVKANVSSTGVITSVNMTGKNSQSLDTTNASPWFNLSMNTKYIWDGGISKDDIQRRSNGTLSVRPGGMVFMRVVKQVPSGHSTGSTIKGPDYPNIDYNDTSWAGVSVGGANTSVTYAMRWSTGIDDKCWAPNESAGSCSLWSGWRDVPYSTGNFPRADMGLSNFGKGNYWEAVATW